MNSGNFSFETIKRAINLDQMGIKTLEISKKLKVPLPLLMKWIENSEILLEMANDTDKEETLETQQEEMSQCSIQPIQLTETVPEVNVKENVKPKKQYNRKVTVKTSEEPSEISDSQKPKRKYVRKAKTQPTTPDPINETSEPSEVIKPIIEISEPNEVIKPKRKYVRKAKPLSATPEPQSVVPVDPPEISQTSDIPIVKKKYSKNMKSNIEIPLVIPLIGTEDTKVTENIQIPDTGKVKRKYNRKPKPVSGIETENLNGICEIAPVQKPKRKYTRKPIPSTPAVEDTNLPIIMEQNEPLKDISMTSLSPISLNAENDLLEKSRDTSISIEPIKLVTHDLHSFEGTSVKQISPKKVFRKPEGFDKSETNKKLKEATVKKVPEVSKNDLLQDISMTSLSSISSNDDKDLPEKSKDTSISIEPIKLVTQDLPSFEGTFVKQISPKKVCEKPKIFDISETKKQLNVGKVQKAPVKKVPVQNVPEVSKKRYVGGFRKKPTDFGPKAGSIMPRNYIITSFEKKTRHNPISYDEKLPTVNFPIPTPVVQKKFKSGLLSHEEINRRRIIFEQILNEMNLLKKSEPCKSCNVIIPSQQEDRIEKAKSNEDQNDVIDIEKNLDFEPGWYEDAIKELISSSEEEPVNDNKNEGVNIAFENDECILNKLDTECDMLSQCPKVRGSANEDEIKQLESDLSSSTSESDSSSSSSDKTTDDKNQISVERNLEADENQDKNYNILKELDLGDESDKRLSSITSTKSKQSRKSGLNANDVDMNELENDLYLSDSSVEKSEHGNSLCETDKRLSSIASTKSKQSHKSDLNANDVDMNQMEMDLYLTDSSDDNSEHGNSLGESDKRLSSISSTKSEQSRKSGLNANDVDMNELENDMYLSDSSVEKSEHGNSLCEIDKRLSSIASTKSKQSHKSDLKANKIDVSLLENDLYLTDSSDDDEDLISVPDEYCKSLNHSYLDEVADELN